LLVKTERHGEGQIAQVLPAGDNGSGSGMCQQL